MILRKLKESTREQHEAVESAVDVMNRMFTLDDYKALIGRFRKFYAAYEPTLPIKELRDAGFDYNTRRKLPSLNADAEVLGITGEESFDELPTISTLAKAFGSLYVIEGSTLGGQVISRHLKEHLGITPENGGAFFNSYGSDVGRMWKEFGEAITNFSGDGNADREIIQGATETFDSIRKCVGK